MSAARSLDDFDLSILRILQEDVKVPQRVIGEAVNLSAPAVQRRIKRMEEEGVIQSNVAVLRPEAVGRPLTIIALVEVESEKVELIDEIKRSFSESLDVQQCYYVTGEVDFILVVTAESMADYEMLTRRLFFGNANVKRFRTFVTMDRIKTGSMIPV